VALAQKHEKVLVVSDHRIVVATHPPHQQVGIEHYHTITNPHKIGHGAQWIFLKEADAWPQGFTATF